MILELRYLNNVLLPYSTETRAEFGRIPNGSVIQVEFKKESKGSMSMLALWWIWMKETAEFMAANGVTMPLMIAKDGTYHGTRPFVKEDAHALFTEKWLGSENGKRLSWSRDKKDSADTGQRHHALTQHEIWCTEKGIKITIPIKSEYREILERMND